MGGCNSSPSPSSPIPPPPTHFPASLCNTTKCGSPPADLSSSQRGRIFQTVQQIPLDYIKHKKVLTCQVVNIPDGDTIRCLHLPGSMVVRHPTKRFAPWRRRLQHETMLVRLYGVDAPERKRYRKEGQPFAEEATKLLEDRLLNKVVFVKLLSVDQYGRALCRVLYLGLRYDEGRGGGSGRGGKEQQQQQEQGNDEEAGRRQQGGSSDGGHSENRNAELMCEGVELEKTKRVWRWLSFLPCAKRGADAEEEEEEEAAGEATDGRKQKNGWKLVECDICEDLLINGYACLYRGYGAVYDDRYDKLVLLETEAKKAKRGMWGLPVVELPGAFKKGLAEKERQQKAAVRGQANV
eukprot:GHVS01083054.1.p1 GENE.GHVS01083054.1~~GHVS01083054.1.p1  ORF type:complete len:351 (-),score=96.75 GHVS01083054.1:9-1061(-)